MKKNIVIFGSTGYIGKQTLEIIKENKDKFKVVGLLAKSNIELLLQQAKEFKVRKIAIVEGKRAYASQEGEYPHATPKKVEKFLEEVWGEACASTLAFFKKVPPERRREGFGQGMCFEPRLLEKSILIEKAGQGATHSKDFETKDDIKIYQGRDACFNLLDDKVDIVVVAIAGIESLRPTLYALKKAKKVALASKEALVCGAKFIKNSQIKKILPIDSEHNAIFNLLQKIKKQDIECIWLTCSGGPFYKRKNLEDITPQEALSHPVWQMGKKITIDSATLINKAFEIIEAHVLFGFSPNKIKVVIHPTSQVHGIVQTKDNSFYMLCSKPDMKIPIANALFYPDIPRFKNQKISLFEKDLKFFKPPTHIPSLKYAYKALESGFGACATLAVADEFAVSLFLQKKIKFTDIFKIIEWSLEKYPLKDDFSLDELEEYKKDLWEKIRKNFSF